MNIAAKLLIVASAVLLFNGLAAAQERDVGKMEYLFSCGGCHNNDAKGEGPAATQLIEAPPDLTKLAKRNGGVFPLNAVYEKIDGRQEVKAHGSRDMPVWGDRYMPWPNLSPDQAFGSKSSRESSHLDFSNDRDTVIRNRIISLIDYLYRIQEK